MKRTCPVEAYATRILSCRASRNVVEGRALHNELRTQRLDRHKFLGNLLVQMYGSCGFVGEAQAAFDAISARRIYSWNILMCAYINNRHLGQARVIYEKMPQWDVVTWTAIHVAYTRIGNLDCAKHIFDSMQERHVITWNTMLALYAQKRQMQACIELFEMMPVRNEVSWNSLISAYVWFKQLRNALAMFQRIPSRNVVTWNTIVTALLEDGDISGASNMYEEMPEKDIVSWTALIIAYARHGFVAKAKGLFLRMPLLDEVSLAAMIAVYARTGCMEEARDLFDRAGSEDPSSWNAMIVGYAQNGQGRKALTMFGLMDLEDVRFDKVTLFSVFDASIGMVSLVEGRALHRIAEECGVFYQDVEIRNSLIKMYGKCGSVGEAQAVFDDVSLERTIVSWNSIATTYTQNGVGKMAVGLFHSLVVEGEKPDEISFLITLTGCSQHGLLEDGLGCFQSIVDHGLVATFDHYMCMVDLLGRAGKLAQAEELMENMPFEPRQAGWRSLLSACRVHNDPDRATRLQVKVMDPESVSGSYTLLSNIYAPF